MLNRLEMMRIFCATAESNNFKEAASRLNISPQVVTRAIKELEQLLGEPLFYRNTRQIRITAFGEALALRAKQAISGMDALFQQSEKQLDHDIAGIVRITAPTTIGRRFLVPVLASLAKQYPQITVDLRLSETIADVIEQQIDIGIRVGFLRDSNYIARACSKVGFSLVATPELLQKIDTPKSLADLMLLPSVSLIDANTHKPWPWIFRDGQQMTPRHFSFLTDDVETEFAMVLQGVGIGQVGQFMAAPYLKSGQLVPLLEELNPPPWELYVYRPQRGPVPTRIRIVYDQIVASFADPTLFESVLFE